MGCESLTEASYELMILFFCIPPSHTITLRWPGGVCFWSGLVEARLTVREEEASHVRGG